MPKTPAPVVGPMAACKVCSAPTSADVIKLCAPCWELWQRIENHAVRLLRNPKAAPAVRELLTKALETQVEPPPEAA